MTHASKRLLPRLGLLVLPIAFSACATAALLRSGQQAEALQDYDRAVVEYAKLLREKPDNQDARQGLERAKIRAALDHFTRGRRYEQSGRLDEALVELQIAADLNPTSRDIEDVLQSVRTQLTTKITSGRLDKTPLESVIERAKGLAPLGTELPSDVRMPDGMTFRDASSRVIYLAIAKFANLNIVFDPQFKDQPISVDLRGASLEDSLQAISASSRSFYRVTAPRTITVVPDTPAKRIEYEDEVVKTFYLSNADLKETSDLLRIVIDARRISTSAATNLIVIKDTRERIATAGRIIDALDKARPEVVIDVELLEVNRARLREYGLQLLSSDSGGIAGGLGVGSDLTLRELRNLNQADLLLTGLPALFFRLLKTDGTTRTLANPQLRTIEGIAAQASWGDEIPIPVTQFQPIATGGLAQQPITSFQYRNVGVNIDITPRMHHDASVTLALKLEVTSISGTGFGDLPTLGNREVNTVIRLRNGETNMLAGLIRDEERTARVTIPGLGNIPVLGKIFSQTRREAQETDIVLMLTPHIVRVLELTEEDLRPFRVGRDGAGSSVIELPIPPLLPPRDPAQDQQPQNPGVPAPTQGPILAPAPGR